MALRQPPRPQRKMAPTQSKPTAPPPSQTSIPNRYYYKSLALKSRIAEITISNSAARERVARNQRALARAQLERAFLLEQVSKLTPTHETEDSPESPGSKVVTPPQRPRMRGNRGPGKGPNRNRGRPKNAGAPNMGELGWEPLRKKTQTDRRFERWDGEEEGDIRARLGNDDTFAARAEGRVEGDSAMSDPMVRANYA